MTADALLPAAFLAGFFGSGHCIGMCGPVVLLLESHEANATYSWAALRRLIYNLGRLLFYVLLGAVAGAIGLLLTKVVGVKAGLSVLRVVAALLVIALGLNLLIDLRILSFLERSGAVLWRRVSPMARHVLPVSTPARALGAGFIWGALPCGLVYSALAIAAVSGSAASGMMIMMVFWMGTLPALLAAGTSARKLAQWAKQPILRRFSGAILLISGIFALAMPYLHFGTGHH